MDKIRVHIHIYKVGRLKRIKRRQYGGCQWEKLFLGADPVYDDTKFRQIHRIPRPLYDEIFLRLEPMLARRCDATGLLPVSAHVRLMGTLRWLGDAGSSVHAQSEQCASPATITIARREVCRLIVETFGPEYLRRPTTDELKEIEAGYRARGFPGCFGVLDCMHVYWRKCPAILKGAYQGKYVYIYYISEYNYYI